MTFLNPLLLIGLAAAAIPLILHLLNRRKLRTVEFSTLRFLKELQQSSLRRLKLRQWLLLALRTLLIIAVVLAFARPALHGSFAGAVGSRAVSTMVVLLDDSPSMGVRNERGQIFNQAREAAHRLLALADESDHVAVLPFSSFAGDSSGMSFERPQLAHATLDRLTTSEITVPVGDFLPRVHRGLEASRDPNREVYLVSDGQATQFAGGKRDGDSTAALDEQIRIYLVRIPPDSPTNAGIVRAAVDSRIVSRGRPVQLSYTVRNFSTVALRQSLASVYLDGSRVLQQALDIPPGTSLFQTTSIVPRKTGILTGFVQIEDDALEADNKRSFVLTLPETYTVIIAGPQTPSTRYPLLALSLGGDSLVAGRMDVRQMTADQLGVTDLGRSQVVVVAGLDALTAAGGAAIVNFLRRGGGGILFPGSRVDAESFNRYLWQPLGLPGWTPAPVSNAAPSDGEGSEGPFLSFARVDLAHPLFAGLLERERPVRRGEIPFDSPKVRRTETMRTDSKGEPIITLSNGEPFLSEYVVGDGRLLLFSVDPGTEWSDFPLKGIFVPLLHRAVAYLSSPPDLDTGVVAGEALRFTLRVPGTPAGSRYSITSPSGVDERVAPRYRPASGQVEFISSPTSETGIYTLKSGESGATQPRAARAVFTAESEGDLRPATTEELAAFWERHGVTADRARLLDVSEDLESRVYESRFGIELWKYFVALSLLLAAAEMLVARDWKHDAA